MSDAFAERRIDVDGTPIRCLERGQGETVVALHGESGATPTSLEQLLAQKCRVLTLESPVFAAGAPQDAARLLARALAALGVSKYALIAGGPAAAVALCHAAEAAAVPETLILLSPAGPLAGAEARLSDIKAPTLVLTGTKDDAATEAAGRLCAERIPESYVMLVYDAGATMATERPAALFEVVADFIERGGRFVLERQESVISP
jgi:pimeloyl-ACP methyl ester carboxylesterase